MSYSELMNATQSAMSCCNNKGRGCYKRATTRPSSKQTVGGSETNAPSPTLKIEKKDSHFKHLR